MSLVPIDRVDDLRAILRCIRYGLPAQPIDATQALNLSAGVSNCKVSRGRKMKNPGIAPGLFDSAQLHSLRQ